MVDYAAAGELLERYFRAWETFDGDAWTELFAEDAEYHEDPFEAPLVGRNAIRAYLLDAAEQQQQVDCTVERHWVSGATVLAAWHASFVRSATRGRVRIAGFLTLELDGDGRIVRLREWWHRRESRTAGSDGEEVRWQGRARSTSSATSTTRSSEMRSTRFDARSSSASTSRA